MSSTLPRGVAGVCWHRESNTELPVAPPLLVRVACLTARLRVRPGHDTLLDVHMGLELQNSFKEVARGDQHGKLTIRHHVFRKYVSPNQICPVFRSKKILVSR